MRANENEVLLSICIPTYNRIAKTSKLVESILEYNGYDVEVIVADNCSTDETEAVLTNIKDNRFKYIRNKANIGGMPNILNSLNYGSGRYVFLCLDKDHVLPENISLFIQRLKQLDVVIGHCSLNSEEFLEDKIYDAGLESILNIAYTSEHPSGLFIKRSVLQQKKIIDDIVKKHMTFAFLPELLKAEVIISGKGKACRINMPFVYTETLEECEKEVSHSYKEDNIYFFPKNIINTFNVYSENLFNLNIPKKNKIIVLEKVFLSLLNASTLGFKKKIANKSVCLHHGINSRNVDLFELIRISYSFSKVFIKSDFSISLFDKFYIFTIANMKIVYLIAVNKFKE